ncbi:MAG: helix-turn-helix domain-containing protein [Sphaerochaeta sp.]
MNTIHLSDDKDLQVFMHPLRQRILTLLAIHGSMTPKQVADSLSMTSSSAKHHILKLVGLGTVEVDRTALINGITATYYKRTDATISIGSVEGGPRAALAQNLLKEVQDGFFSQDRVPEDEDGHCMGDMLTGVLHLRAEEADELIGIIRSYIASHEKIGTKTLPFVYSLVAYHA